MCSVADLLFRAAERFGQRPALAIRRGLRTEVWSYTDLAERARSAAGCLDTAGIKPGDRVLCMAPNSPELVASMFGVWLAGGVLVPVDLRTPPEVIGRVRQQTEPRLLIGDAESVGPAELATISPTKLARGELGAVGGAKCPHPDPSASRSASSGQGSGQAPLPKGEGVGFDAQPPTPDTRHPTPELAEIVFTSGTTGSPKGVMLTHGNILANVRSALDAMPISVGERLLSLLPLSHMMEQTVGLLAAIAAGAAIYYATSRRSTAVQAALERHRIGLLVCVPEILRLLLVGIEREVERSGHARHWTALSRLADRVPIGLRPLLFLSLHRRLGRLRLVLCGGAALDPNIWRAWERLGVRVVQGYGATECAPIVTSNRLTHRLAGAVGWPVRGVELRLAADGEVLVRGPNVTIGYWRDQAATDAAFDDGWYRTGDVGELGPRGELRLLGRKKEMIVLADGRNVFPEDVEAELKSEAAIKDCVVLGKPRPAGGEEVHAVVLPAESPEAVVAAVRRAAARLGAYQQPGGFSIWPEPDFPRTPSLKVKRGEVRTALRQQPQVWADTAPKVPVIDGLEARLRSLLARSTGRPLMEISPDADLTLELGIDSLGRVELAVMGKKNWAARCRMTRWLPYTRSPTYWRRLNRAARRALMAHSQHGPVTIWQASSALRCKSSSCFHSCGEWVGPGGCSDPSGCVVWRDLSSLSLTTPATSTVWSFYRCCRRASGAA
jgi:long-chain acyl-CoA synthetase